MDNMDTPIYDNFNESWTDEDENTWIEILSSTNKTSEDLEKRIQSYINAINAQVKYIQKTKDKEYLIGLYRLLKILNIEARLLEHYHAEGK